MTMTTSDLLMLQFLRWVAERPACYDAARRRVGETSDTVQT